MYKLFPPTAKRVAYYTCNHINEQIREKMLCCIDRNKNGGEAALSDRIEKLDREWDTERILETNAAAMTLLGSIIGYKKSKCCWFLFTGAVGFFFLEHAVQGWCPSLPVIRKMGVRTAEEISNEKVVFKKIRGDFSQDTDDAEQLLSMAEKQ